MPDWQDISTAPRDGEIALRLSDGTQVRASLECLEGGNEDGTGWVFAWALTEDHDLLDDWEDGCAGSTLGSRWRGRDDRPE